MRLPRVIGSPLRSLRHPPLGLVILGLCLLAELLVLNVGLDDLDEGYFLQHAARIQAGQVPYRDFESLYTPGLDYLHAALFGLLGGQYVLAARALSFVFRIGVVVLMYALARRVIDNPLLAALPGVFLIVGFDAAPNRWEPHPGWPSTFFALLAVWFRSKKWLAAAGVAAALTYLFKQNTGVFLLLALGLSTLPRWRDLAVLLGAFALASALWLVPLLIAIDGQLELLKPFIGAVNQAGLFSPPEPIVIIPVLCLVGGLAIARSSRRPDVRWFVLAGVCLFLTQYPRSDSIHLVWSAPLLLVVGAVALQRVKPLPASVLLFWAAILCLPVIEARVDTVTQATTTMLGIPFANALRVPAQTWSDLFTTIAEVQFRTAPGEPIFVYPSSPLVYVLSDRPNPTRFDHVYPGAATRAQLADVMRDLDAADVRVLVVSDFWRSAWGPPGDNAAFEDWLFEQFHEVARFGAYRVFVRAPASL